MDAFSPTPEDVERYQEFRATGMVITHAMVKALPKHAFEEVGDALGIRRNGVLMLGNKELSGVLTDCCLYDWHEGDGRNWVQRYAEAHPPTPGTGEDRMLQAFLRARYRILEAQSVEPDAGLHCRDLLHDEDVFLMEPDFSHSVTPGVVLATRTICPGEFWMTTEAALRVGSQANIGALVSGLRERESRQGQSFIALAFARLCLAQPEFRKPRREPRFPGFKRRRR